MQSSLIAAASLAALTLVYPGVCKAESQSGAVSSTVTRSDEAEENFNVGRALLKDKRYAEACAKFEESQRQDPASGTLLALAYCQELSGRLATSASSYLAAAELAQREGQRERQTAAKERAQVLATRVSKLTVIVPPALLATAGFRLLKDGAEFERAAIGVAVPSDGGNHEFLATAPGRTPWTSSVTLALEGDQKTLLLPMLAPLSVPRNAETKVMPSVSDVSNEPGSRATLQHVSLGLAVASAAGLGLGTAFALSAKSKNDASNADHRCDNGCNTDGIELRNDALSAARASTWSFIAGSALAAASVTVYLIAGRSGRPANRATSVKATVSLGAPAVALSGSF